jgi:hypothetical protein
MERFNSRAIRATSKTPMNIERMSDLGERLLFSGGRFTSSKDCPCESSSEKGRCSPSNGTRTAQRRSALARCSRMAKMVRTSNIETAQ